MLANQSRSSRQSFCAPRSPLNAVSKDFNIQTGSALQTTFQTAPKFDPVPQNEVNEKLSILSHAGAVPCLPYAGEELSGLENAPLPYTSKEHDLVDLLSHVVKKDSTHPKRDSTELVSTIISTQLLSHITLVEMKNHGISMKAFAGALNANAATFSLSLREPRHWFDTSIGVRRSYYAILLWLNLPPKERRGSFKTHSENDLSDDENPSPVENVPNLNLLSAAVLRELKSHSLDFGEFVQKVARYPNECVVRNMLLAPMPWELLSASLRKRYGQMWFWMKQSTVERLRLFNIEYNEDNNNDIVVMKDDEDFGEGERVADQPVVKVPDQVDTQKVAMQVTSCLKTEKMNVDHFSEKVLRLPPRMVTPLIQTPIPWANAKNYQRFVYAAILKYLGCRTEQQSFEIETKEVAKEVLRFLREHGISMADFAAKVVRLQKSTLFGYLNNPVPWYGSNDQQQCSFVIMSHWIDLPKEEKLAQFYHQPNAVDGTPTKPSSHTVKSMENSRETLQAIVEFSKQTFFSNSENKMNLDNSEIINTATLAENLNDLISTGGLNLKNFAAALRVNKTYLASLLQRSVPTWEECTKLQKFIFLAAKNVLKQKSSGFDSLITSSTTVTAPSLPPQSKSHDLKKAKQKRERLSEFQFNYLKDFFQANERPTSEQKQKLADYLGLTLRKVVVFFSNHRVRGFGKKYSTGKSSVCSSNPSSLKQETTAATPVDPACYLKQELEENPILVSNPSSLKQETTAATPVDPASYLKQELEENLISVSNPSSLKQEVDEEVATEAPIAASPE